jgi:hypothetical protein
MHDNLTVARRCTNQPRGAHVESGCLSGLECRANRHKPHCPSCAKAAGLVRQTSYSSGAEIKAASGSLGSYISASPIRTAHKRVEIPARSARSVISSCRSNSAHAPVGVSAKYCTGPSPTPCQRAGRCPGAPLSVQRNGNRESQTRKTITTMNIHTEMQMTFKWHRGLAGTRRLPGQNVRAHRSASNGETAIGGPSVR